MGGSSRSPSRVCDGFLEEVGGRLDGLSIAQYHWQPFSSRKYDLLPGVSVLLCEHDLDWDSGFLYHNAEAISFSLNYRETVGIVFHAQSKFERHSGAGAKIVKGKVWAGIEEYFDRARARAGVA